MSGEEDVQEKLEDIRVAASRSSPMMEAINLVSVQFLNYRAKASH